MAKPVLVPKGPPKVEHFDIWDNYRQHCEELRAIGADDDDLALLKKAAEEVWKHEQADALEGGRNQVIDLSPIDPTSPYTCANGWVFKPPSKVAKRWAANAVMAVTGGREPEPGIGQVYGILAGLWALKACGDGQADVVMRTVCSAGVLAEILPALTDDMGDADIGLLGADYLSLMGLAQKSIGTDQDADSEGKAASPEMEQYEATLQSIRAKYSAGSTPPSPVNSQTPAAISG